MRRMEPREKSPNENMLRDGLGQRMPIGHLTNKQDPCLKVLCRWKCFLLLLPPHSAGISRLQRILLHSWLSLSPPSRSHLHPGKRNKYSWFCFILWHQWVSQIRSQSSNFLLGIYTKTYTLISFLLKVLLYSSLEVAN